ncbi:MAG TPA: extracellular solute-binding protein [Candidatus Hydrogenedentes bacterium]|nr:extracellular solute-binding protein [Candidatus Hydrogenedentota bacterium]
MGFLRHVFRWLSLALIALAGAWLLWPARDGEAASARRDGRDAANRAEARHVITLSPGSAYLPGAVPFGVGQPLVGLAAVIRDFEKRFPDTRVEIINVPGVREYIVTQLSSGRAPDIINVNVEDVWTDVQKGWYVPLDAYLEAPNPFIREKGDPTAPGYHQWWDMFKYQAISRGKAAPDGRNYCISFDMVETAIFYNKDIFAKVGVSVPTTWEQWLDDMAKLEAAGYTPLLMSIYAFNDWCVDLIFDQLYYAVLPGIDLLQDPTREKYLEGYLDWDELCFLYRQGFFTPRDPRYAELWRHMRALRKYCNRNLANIDTDREFVTQQGAMYWTACPLTYRLMADKELGFEWGVFYLPRFTTATSEFASETEMCVIGGAGMQYEVTNSAYNDTGDPATSEKLERVIALLQFMTVPEHYERIVNEYPCFLPNVVGVPVLPSLEPFEAILERRYTTTKWIFTFDLRFSEIQQRMLELYLNDGIALDAFLEWQEANLEAATQNLLARKNVDMARLEREWDRRAPLRADTRGLPYD